MGKGDVEDGGKREEGSERCGEQGGKEERGL